MFKVSQGFIFFLIFSFLILGGCSQGNGDYLELENQELRTRIADIELIVEDQCTQIEQHKKTNGLRNSLDITARQILSALNHGVFSEIEADLLHEDANIEEDRLVFSFNNSSNEIFFFQNKLDFERVRQRFYYLDEQGRFISGYEVDILTNDTQESPDSRVVLIFTFIEESSEWKLADIGIDR